MTTITTTVNAPDISCGGCANAIKRALGAVPGVSAVEVDVASKTVTVTHDDQVAQRTEIAETLDHAGFPVSS